MAKGSEGGPHGHHEETPACTHGHPHEDAASEAQAKSVVCFCDKTTGPIAVIDKPEVAAVNCDQGIYGSTTETYGVAYVSYEAPRRSIIYIRGQPVGTVTAIDKSLGTAPTYNQVFLGDLIPGAVTFLMKGGQLKMKKLLVQTPHHQSRDLGRVARVDSALWTGDISLAEGHNYPRTMRLVLILGLSEKFETSCAVLCVDCDSAVVRTMVFFGGPSALAFLMTGADLILKTFLVQKVIESFKLDLNVIPESIVSSFFQMAVARATPVVSGFWWIILLASYNIGDSCEWTMTLMPEFCFTNGSSTSTDMILSSGFYANPRRVLNSIEDMGGNIIAVICMDEPMDNFFASYESGIGRTRWYCKSKGRTIDVSHIYGCEMEVVTTPPGGSLKYRLEYGGRSLTITLYGRNLYFMGWRGPHGTVEMRAVSETKRSNFMSGDNVILLPTKTNYNLIASGGGVENALLGPYALQQAFEVIYRSQGENTKEVRHAITTIIVHIPEASRLQNVYRDIRTCFQKLWTLRLGKDNAFWVSNYGHYSGEGMNRIDARMSGSSLEPIENRDEANISEVEILSNIRIYSRDGLNRGRFKHEEPHEDPTEKNSGFEDDAEYLSSIERAKFPKKHKKSGDSRRGWPGDEGSPTFFPPCLLEELYPVVIDDEQLDESDDNAESVAEHTDVCEDESQPAEYPVVIDDEQLDESDDNAESVAEHTDICEDESQPAENDDRDDDELEENEEEPKSATLKITDLTSAGRLEEMIEEFFDHFPVAKKMLDFQKKRQSVLEMPMRSIDRVTTWAGAISSATQTNSKMEHVSLSLRAMIDSAGRKLFVQKRPLQPHILRVAPWIHRTIRCARWM